jgi:hypothetical protein
MSLIGRRLQTFSGSKFQSGEFGRRLPSEGFQSVDAQYMAEERCKVLSSADRTIPSENTIEDATQISHDSPSKDNVSVIATNDSDTVQLWEGFQTEEW